jgi:[heparan sulfate]-glucosamine 3-sulfotransferase 5
MIPNYICVGVQKGGTTSLIKYLNLHPDIYMAHGEKHFFDRGLCEGKISDKDIKKYQASFKTTKKIVGEKTPSYCYLRYAIDRIYKYDTNMKLIIILREPISRAFS